MTGFFRLRFSGFLDPPVFQAALNATVQRHPLLRGTIRKTPFRHPEWVDHPEWLPEIQWHAKSMENGFPQTDLLIRNRNPLPDSGLCIVLMATTSLRKSTTVALTLKG